MAPEVYRMGKPYWFRNYPGHEGVTGLHSGVFLDGRSQAFVGSACTLEILDESGELLERIPVFHGPGREFRLADGPGGGRNLLIAQYPAGGASLAVVNSRDPTPPPAFEPSVAQGIQCVDPRYGHHVSVVSPTVHSFSGVPPGHTHVPGGFGSMAVDRVLYEDVDGDGRREVICAANGTWSRVTVYAPDGEPLSNANFGPGSPNRGAGAGRRARVSPVRDVAVLRGGGGATIVAAAASGLAVGLDHQCRKIWSTRLPGAPSALQAAFDHGTGPTAAIVCCTNGAVAAYLFQEAPWVIAGIIARIKVLER